MGWRAREGEAARVSEQGGGGVVVGRQQQSALMTQHGKLVLHWPLQVQGGLLHARGKPLNPGIRPVEATAALAASRQSATSGWLLVDSLRKDRTCTFFPSIAESLNSL